MDPSSNTPQRKRRMNWHWVCSQPPISTYWLLTPCSPTAQDKLWNLSKNPNGLTHAFYTLSHGIRLHYVTSDQRSNEPPKIAPKNVIIFLHGFPDSWALWQSSLSSSTLRFGSALVAVDLPGYGGSDGLENHGATDVLEAVTEFVVGMRELYGIDGEDDMEMPKREKRVIIVGHDWGCIIGSRLAAEAPQLADRFILSNAPHVRSSPTFPSPI